MQLYEQLEQELAQWCECPNTVVCSSGTAALHLALEALELPPGGEVLVPEFTMIACARAVTLARLKPVFVDCGDDLLIDPDLAAAAVTPNTCAIMPVHIYGRRCNMHSLSVIARNRGLAIIEDLAEAHGVLPHSRTDAACWSFYRNKIVAGEEGGAVAFLDPKVAARARQLRNLGFTDAHDFLHSPRGMNYRLANRLAQPILDSLHAITVNQKRRRAIEALYTSLMPDCWLMPPRDVCWVYDIRLRSIDTADMVRRLNRLGVAARLGFRPMSEQPEYFDQQHKRLNAYSLSRRVIYLPVDPDMADATVARYVSTLCCLPLQPWPQSAS